MWGPLESTLVCRAHKTESRCDSLQCQTRTSQRPIMTMLRLSSAFFLLMVAFAAIITSTTVEARYMASYKLKDVFAGASAKISENDCSYEYLSISGSSSARKEKTSQGKPSQSYNQLTTVSYDYYDHCTGETKAGYVDIYPGTFAGDKNGATASATISSIEICTLPVDYCNGEYDCKESAVDWTIDATWTATGSTIKDRSTSSYNSPSFSSKYRYSGTSRETTTVTLQVTQNGEALDLDPSSVSGYLYSSVSGSMEIVRYKN